MAFTFAIRSKRNVSMRGFYASGILTAGSPLGKVERIFFVIPCHRFDAGRCTRSSERWNSFVILFTRYTKRRSDDAVCSLIVDSSRGDDFGLDAYSTNGRVS